MLLRLFSRLIVRVLPVIAALCMVVPAMGGRSLQTDEVWDQFGFTVCDLPCFAGIVPGRTPFEETPYLLRKNIPLIHNRMFSNDVAVDFWATSQRYDLSGLIRHTWGVVNEIRLNSPLPLDHLIGELGMPDCIVLRSENPPSPALIFWIRSEVSIAAALRSDSAVFDLSSRVPVVWMHMGDPTECEASDAIRWRGFAPVWDYAQSTSQLTD